MECPMCVKWEKEPELRIAELDHCYVMLNRDQFFPGYVFVFAKKHVTELFHLEPATRAAIIEEVSMVAEALYSVFAPAKINYELLGNMVPHMHWHVVPRFETDPLWPRPIWSEPHTDIHLSIEHYTTRIAEIRGRLRTRGGNA